MPLSNAQVGEGAVQVEEAKEKGEFSFFLQKSKKFIFFNNIMSNNGGGGGGGSKRPCKYLQT